MRRKTRKKERIRKMAARRLPELWHRVGGKCEKCGEYTKIPRDLLPLGFRLVGGWLVRGSEKIRGASVEHHNGVFAGNGDDNLRMYCIPCNYKGSK